MAFNAPANTASQTPPRVIQNDGFFPDLDVQQARLTLRLDGTVTDVRLAHALTAAIIEVGNSLRDWENAQRVAGYPRLDDVPEDIRISGESRLVHSYLRAVYCLAKADLIERMADYDTTGTGQKRAQWLEEAPDEQRRNARWAIADVQSLPRTFVGLL